MQSPEEWRSRRTAEEKEERDERHRLLPSMKDWGVIAAGKRGWYWIAYRPFGEGRYEDDDAQWFIAEGFTATLEEGRELAHGACEHDAAPYWEGHRKRTHDGSKWVRWIYKERHGRKPKLSDSTETRTQRALGHLWTHHRRMYGNFDEWWREHPITKITAKRVFIAPDRLGGSQRSFDRAALKRHGYAVFTNGTCYYNDATHDAAVSEKARGVKGQFPLLALTHPFTRRDVIRAFRRRSLELHPDRGGDAASFRTLIEEKDRAMSAAPF